MNEQNYTSLELSKKLQEAGFKEESEYYWFNAWKNKEPEWEIIHKSEWDLNGHHESYPVYDILNDLCVKYDKEMFGEDNHKRGLMFPSERRAHDIISYLQMKNKPEAEDYIWEHCLFNPDNK